MRWKPKFSFLPPSLPPPVKKLFVKYKIWYFLTKLLFFCFCDIENFLSNIKFGNFWQTDFLVVLKTFCQKESLVLFDSFAFCDIENFAWWKPKFSFLPQIENLVLFDKLIFLWYWKILSKRNFGTFLFFCFCDIENYACCKPKFSFLPPCLLLLESFLSNQKGG